MRKYLSVFGSLFLVLILTAVLFSVKKAIVFKSDISLPYYFLIIGMDSDTSQSVSRTDTIILAGINKGKIIFLPIPRDLMISSGNTEKRINALYSTLGKDSFLKTVSDLSGVQVKDYIIFNYSIFKTLGDEIAPIRVFVESNMSYTDYHQNLFINFKQGYNDMDGEKLLYYMRFRNDEMGDLGRIQRQKKAFYSILDRAKNLGMTKLVDLIDIVKKETINTFSSSDLFKLYSYAKSSEIEFLEFPYIIKESYVISDNKRLEEVKAYLVKFEKNEEVKKPSVMFIRNNSAYYIAFYNEIYAKWKAKGYLIYVPDVTFDFLEKSKSYILVKNQQKYPNIKKDTQATFSKDFIDIPTAGETYFSIVKKVSSSFIDFTLYDAVVIIGDK